MKDVITALSPSQCGVMGLCELRRGHGGEHSTSVDRALAARDVVTEQPDELRGMPRYPAQSEALTLRAALARAIEGGYVSDSIDFDLYQNDAVYHAVVYEIREARAALGVKE